MSAQNSLTGRGLGGVGEAPAPRRSRLNRRLLGLAAALLALVLLNVAMTPNFLQLQTLAVNVSQVAPVVIVALGMTLVIATGGVDLSVGAVMAVAGALAPLIFGSGWGVANPGLGLAAAFVGPLLVAAACGLFNGSLVSFLGVQPIIATLILFISGRGVALVLTNGNLQTFTNPSFTWLGTGRALGIPVMGWIALALALVVAVVVRKTIYGRYLLSVGGNERAASLAGTPVATVKIWTYLICSTLAGLAGLIVVAQNSASDAARIGNLMELDAIAAAVVGGAALSGGRAPILGTLLGALFIQLVGYTLVANGVPDEATFIVTAAIIVIAVWLQDSRRRT
ncbi:ABC sugar transporter, inner membrane subunit [Rubellimicrobium mesophilum DSM 19309]|uniref:ABC sugar transporter, inner membrane subunit n=1 Tax=Rubellimicrobium mesophilum DSM 19309 TaxID=442562 RepID=A0A017HMZ9_9RHOB|nr:ABC transporter permease [Rubellimicrobium mesophilum]EYD75690.1 ABC sugar transporter, inner membrane subunit [Rubellimicrobium mesophilum DSM 19309]